MASLLQDLRPADDREAGFVEDMRRLLELPGAPFSRRHFEPGHFTASAFVMSPEGGEVLLIHHGKLNRWLQPGGHFEPDDVDVFGAALREVSEEVGLTDLDLPLGRALFDVDVHEIPPLKGDPAHRHFDLRVLLRARTREHRAGSDAKAARWVALDDVTLDASDASVLRAIDKIRRL